MIRYLTVNPSGKYTVSKWFWTRYIFAFPIKPGFYSGLFNLMRRDDEHPVKIVTDSSYRLFENPHTDAECIVYNNKTHKYSVQTSFDRTHCCWETIAKYIE